MEHQNSHDEASKHTRWSIKTHTMKHQNMFYPRADADLSLYAHPLAADEPRTGLRSVDYNKALPPLRNAIVSITLDNETKTDNHPFYAVSGPIQEYSPSLFEKLMYACV